MDEPKEALAAWAGDKIGVTFAPPYTCLGSVDATGKLTAVVVFNMFTENDIELSVAADRVPYELLRECFDYVINQLKCKRATFRTRADNHAAKKALFRIGAVLEGRQRNYFGDCDGLLFGILKDDYKFKR